LSARTGADPADHVRFTNWWMEARKGAAYIAQAFNPKGVQVMLRKLVSAALAMGLAFPASAQDRREEFVFDSYVSGIKIGVVRFNAVERGSSYALAGNMNTAGIVGIFHKMAYDATARGTVRGNSFSPSRYSEKGFSGNWHTDVVVEWKGGIPTMTKHEPVLEPKPHHPDPAKERGTIDSLTALYATLRELPPEMACTGSWQLFDGRQGATLRLHSPKKVGDKLECKGEYRRRSGFTEQELKDRTVFPFDLLYEPREGGKLRVSELTTASIFGTVRMVRR
jgi:hypothetical protein